MKKKMQKSLAVFGSMLLGAVVAQPVLAAGTVSPTQQVQGNTVVDVNSNVMEIEGRLGLGYLNGESNELVYNDDGSKLSQLVWKLDNIFMLNAGVSFKPTTWIKFNADIWVALNDGDNTMDDYDWLVTGWDYTNWSHHEDVPLEKGLMFDINAEVPFYTYQNTSFSALIGVKHDTWEWESYGGHYVYSTYSFRDSSLDFDPNDKIITYEQMWTVPYIGLAFYSVLTNWDISGRVIFSPLVQGEDEDTHHLRDLLFEEDFDSSWMWAADLAITYKFSPNWGLTGLLSYQYYDEAKGSTTITDLTTGQKYYYPGDAAGADNTATMLSLRLDYTF
ncbi:omptin family outer membrane protease [Desulfogranum japonicum]|uniref:omptin family outer membrane protease n=1 Tax=Desulfogranum japonicum TaxID=231447 RepID=UPI0003F806F4|nr:omptin family outer membrane protease [Desulfogranum japonicum]